MNGKIVLLTHPSDHVLRRLTGSLTNAGCKVMRSTSEDDAWSRFEDVLEPDVLVAHLGTEEPDDRWIGNRIRRARPHLPVVVLAEDRRSALRRGFVDLVSPPFDDEEVVLVTRLSLERAEPEGNLSGDLDKMSLPDLLQTSAVNGRSGQIVARFSGKTGRLWLRDGRVIDARLEDGDRTLTGREAVFVLVTWQEGTFTADFGPVAVPERITESTAGLLLEAMRRLDEARRDEEPEHAGLPDEPPAPTAEEKAAHHALLLLNVAASWVSDHLVPKVLAQRLESARREVAAAHPWVERFRVDEDHARVVALPGALPRGEEIPVLARAVAAWLKDFMARVERAVPGRYDLERLSVLTGAHRRELAEQGFAEALGWSTQLGVSDDETSEPSPAALETTPGSPAATPESSQPSASEEAL